MPAEHEVRSSGELRQRIANRSQSVLRYEGLPRAATCSDERFGTAENVRKTLFEVLDDRVPDVMADSVI